MVYKRIEVYYYYSLLHLINYIIKTGILSFNNKFGLFLISFSLSFEIFPIYLYVFLLIHKLTDILVRISALFVLTRNEWIQLVSVLFFKPKVKKLAQCDALFVQFKQKNGLT